MFKSIIVAYDGSEHANKALDIGIDLAKKYGSKLDIVEVIDTAMLTGMGLAPVPAEVVDQIYGKAKREVEMAKNKAIQAGISNVGGETLEGDPASSILEYAGKNGADLIVTGSRGLSTLKRIVLGSVSSRIVQESKIPVLVVK
ncbi:universal stress protein [Sulfuracidifex metallicus]|jgi:nucleotide-binding universal stress UspA family protein|uniref:Universal stress protein n=1 Tax=Sulfuracidifex metallicus DSM 6482 = JCM 9184 TaxID=523847 RepID=A0A6A9QGJ8_SULME|nr:universal stress protein [Sulfuracidifex metallicus]MUN28206.1 universal stress protein [Sulfuracidifex metallicus DSM 6482 = JCM 9184]WOE51260.1 universal stress protein [Sulfuracidifex metallicus DSM 6482 = JCM 9184]